MSRREVMARLLWKQALEGDLAACRLLLEYIDGKPVQAVAAAVAHGGPRPITADEMARAQEAVAAWIVQRTASNALHLPEPLDGGQDEP